MSVKPSFSIFDDFCGVIGLNRPIQAIASG